MNIQRPERGSHKMAFGLSVKEQELMVLGEVTVNPGHERGSFLEKVGSSWFDREQEISRLQLLCKSSSISF